jgi:hypothetical protein
MAPRHTNIPHWTAGLAVGDEVEVQILCRQAGEAGGAETKWVPAFVCGKHPWVGAGQLLEVEVDPLIEMPTNQAMQRLANRGNPHHRGYGGGFAEPSEEEAAKEVLRPVVVNGASIVPPSSWNVAMPASRGETATILINTDMTPLAARSAACAAMIEQSPELLSVGRRVLLAGTGGGRSGTQNAVVLGNVAIEGKQQHIVMLHGKAVELMDCPGPLGALKRP